MSLIFDYKLTTFWHAAHGGWDDVEIGGVPLHTYPVFELLECVGRVRVDAALEIAPEVFDRIEIRRPRRPVDHINAMVVEPFSTRASSMRRCVVLLEPATVREAKRCAQTQPD